MKQFQKISRDHRLDQGEKMDFDQFLVFFGMRWGWKEVEKNLGNSEKCIQMN